MGKERKLSICTEVVHGAQGYDPTTGAVSFPIYQSATFRHPGLHQTTGYDYSRLQNPTREELERTIAKLEGGRFGFAFASGMAAISTVLALFRPGDHIVITDDLYGGTYRICEEVYRRYGLEFTYVDPRNPKEVEAACRGNTKAIFVETPSNPMMKVADLGWMGALAERAGLWLIVDNTFLTPYFQRPLELGAHMVVHSGSKYLGGHNDTLAGLLVVDDPELAERLALLQKSEGAVLAPFDCWLLLRGIKTLAIRLEKQQENALKIARWLSTHPKVEKVNYVGLPEHEGHQVMKAQASGFGAMISFNVKEVGLVAQVLERVETIIFAESLGGVESLITYPVVQTHAAIPEGIRNRIGVTDTLLRLSVGIEAVEDLIADLEQALC
ncbi:trans-sulfuration enzyme family protein [Anaerotalea alkaliphila]|uniref:PLP-dependent transferase n=1 Tax=Anaerotalea alkaliphila TaxID=2662126 RepID=A0A7X5HVM6_9FIRM|nr:PLP-dependent aspartate aminotransferase family protein [Anaerotalea alkaliphila]NDL67271.1 PLP-dependent transferase [Anaerotalea alkaliphila]